MQVLALSIFLLVVIQAQAGSPPTITLPSDAEVVTIVGNGFKLDVTQLVKMQSDWKAVADDLRKEKEDELNVEDTSSNGENAPPDDLPESEKQTESNESDEKDYCDLEDDLHTWIEDRATALADRVERYSEEVVSLAKGPRVVSQVLLLNTLQDLESLTKENIKSLKWIKNKLRWIMAVRDGLASEVSLWVAQKIKENRDLEPSVRGKNDPGSKWLTNVQAIKRIMHEQRFSEPIRESIVDFLGGEFNMMQRSRVYDINKPAKILDDDLYYYRAKGLIPAYFPFFSQDSIINGAQL